MGPYECLTTTGQTMRTKRKRQSDEEAQEVWKVGFVVQHAAALQTRLIRLSDAADITPRTGKAQ